MTTLICDFQSIVGKKIKGYATLTAGQTRPAYDAPSVVVHDPIEKEVVEGRAVFENVNPGDAVITVDWEDQSSTIRFVVPNSEEDVYLSDCLTGDYFTPEEIDLIRWGIKEQISGARELIESTANAGMDGITGSIADYFTEAAEILRKALEAAQLAEQSLDTIDSKVQATEGVVTDVDQAKQQIQDLLDELAALEQGLGETNTDLAGAVETINTISPQVSAATQAASAATQKAQNAVNELNNVQNANAAEFNAIKQDLDSAAQTAKQATDAVAQTNQQLGIEVQRILGEVDVALGTATEATAQARIANENLETYQYQLGEIHQEQGHILSQQAEIVGSFEHQIAEIERLSAEISTAASEIETISGEQTALVTEMNTQVGSLQELTAAQGAAINAAKSQADKGVTDAAAASNALSSYKKVNDPKVTKAQQDATKGINNAATALAKANEANNKLPSITADVSAAAQNALDAVNALPGIRTDISTAKQQADKGVQDAATAKSAVDNLEIGGRNLLRASNPDAGKVSAYPWGTFPLTETLTEGEIVSISIKGTLPEGRTSWMVFNSGGWVSVAGAGSLPPNNEGVVTWTGPWKTSHATNPASSTHIAVYGARGTTEHANFPGETYIEWIKLERGSKATDWTPAPEDVDAGISEAQTEAETARTEAGTAKARADKGVTDAATAKSAADAAKKQADKGVADAKAVADQIPSINTKITNLTKDQSTLGAKAQQGIDEAKVAAELVKNRVDVGTSLVGLIPGTTRPAWSMGMEPAPESENPLGLADAYVARSGEVGNHEYVSVSASDKVKYRVSFWLKASEPGSDLVFDARSPFSVGGDTLAFAGNEAVEGALNPGDAGRVFWVRNVPTEWTYYEGIKTPAQGLKRFYIGTRYWRHNGGSNRTADQYVADLRIEPVIPSQDAVNKLLIDTAQNHSDILKAQGDINTAQGEINANNQAFQTWQKTINDQQKKWNDASTNATAALARFAITQSQWNTLSSTATNANAKAIASHAALFEGQNKWNEVAAAAIQTQADFATKQLEWNAVQKKVNDNFQNWQNAAKEMLDASGKFQVLQTQFNSDQKKWNATQMLVNDSQKGINALNNKTDDAQTLAIQGLSAAVSLSFPHMNVAPNDSSGRPWWAVGMGQNNTFTPPGFPEGPSYYTSSSSISNVNPDAMITVVPGIDYKLEFWTARVDAGTAEAYVDLRNESGTVVLTHWANVTDGIPTEISWSSRSYAGGGLPSSTAWERKVYLLRVKPGTEKMALHFRPGATATTNGTRVRFWGAHLTAYLPVQEQIDSAQNSAIEALNRFAINQSEWNKVSADATNALKAGQAAQQELNQKREDWENGATLALTHLGDFVTKQTKWNKASSDATEALRQYTANQAKWTQGANLAIANLQTFAADQKKWNEAAQDASNALFSITNEQGTIIQANKDLAAGISDIVAKQEEQLTMLRAVQEDSATEVTRAFVAANYGTNSGAEMDDYIQIRKPSSESGDYAVDARGQTWLGTLMISWIYSNGEPGTRTEKLSPTNSRTFVIPRRPGSNYSVDLAYIRVDYRVAKATQGRDVASFTNSITVPIGWAELSGTRFVAPESADYIISFSLDWVNTTKAGKRYGLRMRKGSTPIKTHTQDNIGPNFPWEDGRRTQSITWKGRVAKNETIYFDSCIDRKATSNSLPTTDQRAVDNRSRIVTWMRGEI